MLKVNHQSDLEVERAKSRLTVYETVAGSSTFEAYMFQPQSSSKLEVCNKPSIFGGGPMVAKIWGFRLSGKPEKCISLGPCFVVN